MKTCRLVTNAVLLSLVAALTVGCSSDDDPTTPPDSTTLTLSGTVGAAGGILTSADGEMSLTVPPGALAADVEITMTEVDPASVATVFDGFEVVKAFSFSPPDLDLGSDAEWELEMDWPASTTKADEVMAELPVSVISLGDMQVNPMRTVTEQLAILTLMPAPQTNIANIKIRGIQATNVAIVTLPEVNPFVGRIQVSGGLSGEGTATVNTPFTLVGRVGFSPSLVPVEPFRYVTGEDMSDFLQHLENGDALDPIDEGTYENGSSYVDTECSFTGLSLGNSELNCGISFKYGFGTDYWDRFEHLTGPVEDLDLKINFPSVNVEINENGNTDGPVSTGVWGTGTFGLEGGCLLRGVQWAHSGEATLSGTNGTAFYDLHSDPPLQSTFSGLQFEGANQYGSFMITLGHNFLKTPGDERIALISYGATGGAITEWFPDDDEFGWSQLIAFQQNVTDAQPLDNDLFSEGFVYVSNSYNQVQILTYDVEGGTYLNEGPYANFPAATGAAVTAFVRQNGSMLVATDGTPGQLFVHDRSSTGAEATLVATVGDSPRRLRVAGDIAVVSNFGSDNLSVFTWDGSDNVTLTETIAVGDGPVGIDVLALPSGQVGILSTGFNDNTWTLSVVTGAGALVSNTTTALPNGALAPGHAIWLDLQGAQAMITCNGSDNVVVVDSGL
ncbi:MAG: hypothetical protein GY780_15925 [bacterium]|nr:hypothetical protein [bacterium]